VAVAAAYDAAIEASQENTFFQLESFLEIVEDDSSLYQPVTDTVGVLLETVLRTAADSAIGRKATSQATKKHAWFWDLELRELARRRRQCYRLYITSGDTRVRERMREELSNIKRIIKRLVRHKKRQAYQKFMDDLEGDSFVEMSRKIKSINRARSQRMSGLPSSPETVQATEDHFSKVFAGLPCDDDTSEAERRQLAGLDLLDSDMPRLLDAFSVDNVQLALDEMPRRKAAGKDGIPPELLKAADTAPMLAEAFRMFARFGVVPSEWRRALICPIYKRKGGTADPANYRPIALLSVIRKVFEKCLLRHLRETTRPPSLFQGGFRTKRGTLDQIATLLELQRGQRRRGQSARLAFLDIKGAYDSVARDRLWIKCADHGVKKNEMALLRGLFDEPRVSVLVGQSETAEFAGRAGIQQGSSISPWLYTMFMDDLIEELARSGHGVKLCDTLAIKVPCLFFADDIALTGSNWPDLAAMLAICETHARTNRYQYGAAKCEVLRPQGTTSSLVPPMRLDGQRLTTTESFVYLGLPICSEGIDTAAWLRRAEKKGRAAIAGLRRLGLHEKGFAWQTAVRLYRTFIRPTMEYGLALMNVASPRLKWLEGIQLDALRNSTTPSEIAAKRGKTVEEIFG
jgi:hypothetical protein